MKLKSSEPFWLVKNGIINSYESLREDIETDILIIGIGITGSLIAHQMIKDGYKTTIIDRRETANGSTLATTAMLQYELDVPMHKLIDLIGEKGAVLSYKSCFDSMDKLKSIIAEIKSNCGFVEKDSLYFAETKKDEIGLKKEFEVRKKYNFPVNWLEPPEIEKKYKLHAKYGGIISKKGADIDAFKLAHDLQNFNSKKGLKIYYKTDAVNFNYSKNGVTVTTEHGNIIKAKKLIFCNGFECVEIIKEKIVKLLSTYAMVNEKEESIANLNKTLYWNTANPYMYMRTTDDNRLLIGGGDENFANAKKRDTLIGKKTEKLENYLKKVFPNHNFRTDFSWAGTFGETKDGLPYIGPSKSFPSTYFVLGFGGNGITFSVIGMDIISDQLKDRKNEIGEYFRFGR